MVDSKRKTEEISKAPEQAEIDRLIQHHDSALISKHRGLIDKFLTIAERKVSVLDDYGDENWDALDEEIKRCALKIAKIEGDKGGATVKGERQWLWYRLSAPGRVDISARRGRAPPLAKIQEPLREP
jgi:hypothetical protein